MSDGLYYWYVYEFICNGQKHELITEDFYKEFERKEIGTIQSFMVNPKNPKEYLYDLKVTIISSTIIGIIMIISGLLTIINILSTSTFII